LTVKAEDEGSKDEVNFGIIFMYYLWNGDSNYYYILIINILIINKSRFILLMRKNKDLFIGIDLGSSFIKISIVD
jgi:hypothetical protein